MSDYETDFESDTFDEEAEPSPNTLATTLTSEYPLHTDGQLIGSSMSSRTWLLTPKMLKKLAAQKMINLEGRYKLQKRYIPAHLYPPLFAEAARLKNDEAISFMVSTWPFPVLNFNELELPLECRFGFFTRSGSEQEIPLAESVIRGLLYRSRMYCKMQMMILPKDLMEASEILKYFMRVGIHYLRDLPDVKLPKLLRNAYYYDGDKYMELVKKVPTKKPISWAVYRKDNVRLIISMPLAVVHFIGKRQNFDDVVVGLILQRHSPFLFHFNCLALCNINETKIAGAILDRIVNPLGVTKLVLHNNRFYRPDDVVKMVSVLSPVLRKFRRLRSLFFRVRSLLGVQAASESGELELYANAMADLRNLRRAGFDDQTLTDKLYVVLSPLSKPLFKLSLARANLSPKDLVYLSTSHHAPTLRILRLDGNDLHAASDEFIELFSKLTSISVLQTKNCRLTTEDSMRFATVVGQSTTIRSWSFIRNYVHQVEDIKSFIQLCSRSSSLREIGCLPVDFQKVFGRLFMHNRFILSDEDKDDLVEYALSFGINLV